MPYTEQQVNTFREEIQKEIAQLRKYVHALKQFIIYVEVMNKYGASTSDKVKMLEERDAIEKGIADLRKEIDAHDFERVHHKLKKIQDEQGID